MMTHLLEAWHTLAPFAPIIIVMITILAVMIAIAIERTHFVSATISVLGLNTGLFVLILQMVGLVAVPQLGNVDPMFVVDPFAQYSMVIIFVSALACTTLAYPYFRTFTDQKEELYLLMLLSTAGALLMVCAQNMASFFVSLELLSVPLYGMLAYAFMRRHSLESGLKYLVLSATASATLLMGMAFIYAHTGTLDFKGIAEAYLSTPVTPLLVLGVSLMIFAIGFKLSAAPFHIWTADVYQGAPAPVATFLASVSKVATMAVMVRFFLSSGLVLLPSVQMLFMILATLSIIVGNLLAVRQNNLKRLLGYSSIAHMGYVLVIIASLGPVMNTIGLKSYAYINMYMAVYALSSLGLFGVITLMSASYRESSDASDLSNYRGLFWQRPVLTGVMTVMLLSLAGIPLTAGFVTKFFAVFAAVERQSWFLAAMIIVGSAIGLFYYLRVMLTLFKRPRDKIEFDAINHWGIQAGGLMVLLTTFIVLYFGILPEQFIEWSTAAVIW